MLKLIYKLYRIITGKRIIYNLALAINLEDNHIVELHDIKLKMKPNIGEYIKPKSCDKHYYITKISHDLGFFQNVWIMCELPN